jgi:hypothetical protein
VLAALIVGFILLVFIGSMDWFQELMGKKVKKSRAPLKKKQVTTHSPKKVPLQSNPSLETVGDCCFCQCPECMWKYGNS